MTSTTKSNGVRFHLFSLYIASVCEITSTTNSDNVRFHLFSLSSASLCVLRNIMVISVYLSTSRPNTSLPIFCSSHILSWRFFFLLLPLPQRNSDPESQIKLFSSPPHYRTRLHLYREKAPALSPFVDSIRIATQKQVVQGLRSASG